MGVWTILLISVAQADPATELPVVVEGLRAMRRAVPPRCRAPRLRGRVREGSLLGESRQVDDLRRYMIRWAAQLARCEGEDASSWEAALWSDHRETAAQREELDRGLVAMLAVHGQDEAAARWLALAAEAREGMADRGRRCRCQGQLYPGQAPVYGMVYSEWHAAASDLSVLSLEGCIHREAHTTCPTGCVTSDPVEGDPVVPERLGMAAFAAPSVRLLVSGAPEALAALSTPDLSALEVCDLRAAVTLDSPGEDAAWTLRLPSRRAQSAACVAGWVADTLPTAGLWAVRVEGEQGQREDGPTQRMETGFELGP